MGYRKCDREVQVSRLSLPLARPFGMDVYGGCSSNFYRRPATASMVTGIRTIISPRDKHFQFYHLACLQELFITYGRVQIQET